VVSSRQSGCTPLLACGYHGWTYNLKGELVKAPKFDRLADFKKDENSLFEVYLEVDAVGVVWVNVGAQAIPQTQLDVAGFSKYRVDTWELDGVFNWKVAGNNPSPFSRLHRSF
jgi:phenylpropionate dioxygenase-like ring-hydroxylating dioxygenase large terminal subunit